MASSGYAGASPNAMHERSQAWLSEHRARLEAAADHEERRQLSSLRAAPQIDGASARMAASSARAGVDVSTRLFKDAEKLREARRQQEEEAIANSFAGIPAITKYAAAKHRDGDIADRLYGQARELEAKRRAAAEEADRAQREAIRAAAAAATPRSRRRSLDASQADAAAPRHTVEQLYRLGQDRKAKQQAALKALEEEAKALAKPKLNP
jgi:hypothetical protein